MFRRNTHSDELHDVWYDGGVQCGGVAAVRWWCCVLVVLGFLEVLVLGSDDRRIIHWDWETGHVKLSFHSGHHNNVLQAKFMPYNEDRSIVTYSWVLLMQCLWRWRWVMAVDLVVAWGAVGVVVAVDGDGDAVRDSVELVVTTVDGGHRLD
ncbi:unnamed protein product [Fraxinus pennsylvanica]|uniref:Uncharacterized protein n=1 Tax=Fraxinus pennsylvanica TaxID=56036 RepID=A0AAD1Z8H8_9LAMI|nr:unnamed protein product [Fraxinus pennsylvanica]